MSICCLIVIAIFLFVIGIVVSVLFLCFCKNKTVEKCSIENIFSSFLCFLFFTIVALLLFAYFITSEIKGKELSLQEKSLQKTTNNNPSDCCKKLECCHERD